MKVLIVDDHEAVLTGLSLLIQSEAPRLQLAGLARNGAEALQLAHSLRPDVIVLDLCLAGENGLDLLPTLRQGGATAIVVLTSCTDAQSRARASALGVHGYVNKVAPAAVLLAAIDAAGAARSAAA
ncbi:MAG TPA: response regulator transcription factor [Burkholderiaceae bacterium]|nr:response regulator transcription factor [Burkholderiaceae bacterium]